MEYLKKQKTSIFILALVAMILCTSGCSYNRTADRPIIREVVVETEGPIPPGTVRYVWEEPMIDVVDVPPGLDPEGIYYRPGHQEVVEVRQGRWRHYEFSEDSK